MRKNVGTTVGVPLSAVRYDEVATALGCHGELVEKTDQLLPALDRALAAGLPAVVQVLVDADENENPPGLDDFAAIYGAENT